VNVFAQIAENSQNAIYVTLVLVNIVKKSVHMEHLKVMKITKIKERKFVRTVELTRLQGQRLADITSVCIYDDKSFKLAISKLFEMYSNQRENIKYLQEECTKNGIRTLIN